METICRTRSKTKKLHWDNWRESWKLYKDSWWLDASKRIIWWLDVLVRFLKAESKEKWGMRASNLLRLRLIRKKTYSKCRLTFRKPMTRSEIWRRRNINRSQSRGKLPKFTPRLRDAFKGLRQLIKTCQSEIKQTSKLILWRLSRSCRQQISRSSTSLTRCSPEPLKKWTSQMRPTSIRQCDRLCKKLVETITIYKKLQTASTE